MICGINDDEAIEEGGEARFDWLRQFVPLENGVSSHDTSGRVLAALCPVLDGEIVAMDGKTARGSRDASCGAPAIHTVSAFVAVPASRLDK